jgi:hypothetical protein
MPKTSELLKKALSNGRTARKVRLAVIATLVLLVFVMWGIKSGLSAREGQGAGEVASPTPTRTYDADLLPPTTGATSVPDASTPRPPGTLMAAYMTVREAAELFLKGDALSFANLADDETSKKVAASEPPPPGLVIEEITGVDDPNSPFIQEGIVKTSGGHAWSLQVTWSDERQRWLVSSVEYLP